jgi:hypothetical protein
LGDTCDVAGESRGDDMAEPCHAAIMWHAKRRRNREGVAVKPRRCRAQLLIRSQRCGSAFDSNGELSGCRRPLHVIASNAKQSRATHADWIASSKGLLAMTGRGWCANSQRHCELREAIAVRTIYPPLWKACGERKLTPMRTRATHAVEMPRRLAPRC